MQQAKPWWQSKGVWGGILASTSGVAAAVWGYNISPDEQDALASAIPGAIAGVGGVVAIVGRLFARREIRGGKQDGNSLLAGLLAVLVMAAVMSACVASVELGVQDRHGQSLDLAVDCERTETNNNATVR